MEIKGSTLNRYVISAAVLLALANQSGATDQVKANPMNAENPAATAVSRALGIDLQNVDDKVRAQDDFYRHINGKWLQKTEIPSDKSSWGAFYELRESTLPQLRAIVDSLSQSANLPAGSEAQKIADLHASFMNEKLLETLGTKPLDQEFSRIAALKDKKQIPALIAHFNRVGISAPYNMGIHQDAREPTKYIVDLAQSGLGLPDRDYYLKDDDAKLKEARVKYQGHIEKMLTMNGASAAAATADAAAIVALETALAKVQWSRVENRDPVKTYNKRLLKELDVMAPGYDWNSYLVNAGVDGKIDYVIISQPGYFTGFNKVLNDTPLASWQAYFRWHVLSTYARYLSKPYVEQNFAFYSTVLRGTPENEPRWKRSMRLIEGAIGEGLGKLYVDKHFPPQSKAHMEKLVGNLLASYRQSIDTLDWMSPATKKEAQTKLAKFSTKIGYPNKWRDYSALTIDKSDLVGNVMRADMFEYQRNLDKLGKPIDRDEWDMTPQTVNAYYNPELNEIVFPAAILQPPFFSAQADDAANYGGIGAVIGHEISHGFDDQGSQYDGDGKLRDWWTKDDHEKFAVKTRALVAQYNAFSPLPGYTVNGELTLGENIADNSGLAIAYKAYRLSLGGKEAPVMDGFSGDQRFYMGWAQVWRAKVRDPQVIVGIKSDPHSPPQFRGNGPLQNQPGFYGAFGVKAGDKMYLAPESRVIIW
jgi:putative endopeptidase